MSDQELRKHRQTFQKAIALYMKYYQLNLPSFLSFLNEKIECSSYLIGEIQDIVQGLQGGQSKFGEKDLKQYLHLIAAAQAKVDIRSIEIWAMREYYSIKFISKKNKPEKKEEKAIGKVEKKEVKEGSNERKLQTKQLALGAYKITNKSRQEQIKEQQQAIHQPPIKKKSSSREKYAKTIDKRQDLKVIEQDMNQNRSSSLFYVSEKAQIMSFDKKQLQITGYQKFGQDYLNPIIKYKIIFDEKYSVYRRYTQFQQLISYLNKQYEGFILPQLPPKQGIKRTFSYFWGVDEAFLNDRQIKLEQMMVSLLQSKYVNTDEVLLKFLKQQNFEMSATQEDGVTSYLRSFRNIAFNAKQLKDYGMAYYNYLMEYKKTQLRNTITDKYKQIQPLLTTFCSLNNYRLKINSNFDQRRQIFRDLQMDKDDRNLVITDFDNTLSGVAADIKYLNNQYEKYIELKCQESWLSYLIRQKEGEGGSGAEQTRRSRTAVEERLKKMQANFMASLEDFRAEKESILKIVGPQMIQWRRKIHP